MDLAPLLGENIPQGLIIGFLVGIVFQLASKTIQLMLVVQFVLIKWLEARGILVIDWNRLTAGFLGQKEFVIQETQSLFESLVEMGVFGASMALGFFIGRKITK